MLVISAVDSRRSRPSRRVCGAVISFVMLIAACGTAGDVPIPGAAAPPAALESRPSESSPVESTSEQGAFVEVETTPPTTSAAVSAESVATTVSEPITDSIPETPPDADVENPTTLPPLYVPAPVVPVVSGWAAFDQQLMTILADGSSAVSASVMRDGEIIHEVALGERTLGGDPVDVGDRYRVASISKMITAITVLQLVELGLVGIDDIVGPRLAARVGVSTPSSGVETITVRHLLTHRSGIGQYENLMFRRQVESCPAAGASGLARGLERAPGTTYRYSNLNFCLLGLLIEDVTGEAYEAVVDRELLDPLGIDGMRLAGTFDVGADDVEHESDDGRNYMEVLAGAGSWIASPTDIVRIVDSLDLTTPGWKPLGPAAHAEMMTITVDPPVPPAPDEPVTDPATTTTTTTTVVPTPPTRGYGMGLMIFGDGAFGHTGTLESTSAMTARQPDGISWAITVSGDSPGSGRNLAPIVADAFRYAGEI